jgi:hypothetical protein
MQRGCPQTPVQRTHEQNPKMRTMYVFVSDVARGPTPCAASSPRASLQVLLLFTHLPHNFDRLHRRRRLPLHACECCLGGVCAAVIQHALALLCALSRWASVSTTIPTPLWVLHCPPHNRHIHSLRDPTPRYRTLCLGTCAGAYQPDSADRVFLDGGIHWCGSLTDGE